MRQYAKMGVAAFLAIAGFSATSSAQDAAHMMGVYRPSTSMWYLDMNDNGIWDGCGAGQPDKCVPYGQAYDDAPLVGHFDSPWYQDMYTEIGVYRPSNVTWYEDLNGDYVRQGQPPDRLFQFSTPFMGSTVIASQFSKAGTTTQCWDYRDCVARFVGGTWYIDMNNNGTWDPGGGDYAASFGQAGDLPVMVNGCMAVYRNGNWYIDKYNNFDYGAGDTFVPYPNFGDPGDKPVSGCWSGSCPTNKQCLGVFRSYNGYGYWYRDMNCNRMWDAGDVVTQFGDADDIPVVGKWR